MTLRPALLALILVIACLVGLSFPERSSARVPKGFVAITAEDILAGNANYRTTNLSAMSAIGIQSIRQTFNWSEIERRRGRYNLRRYDDYVAKCAAHGVDVIPLLFNPPLFRAKRRRSRPTYPPKSNRSMAAFARVLVRRYGPRGSLWREQPSVPKRPIRIWQVWNEPNLRIYWGGRPNARAYVRLLKAVTRAIKRSDRGAKVISAGVAPSKLKGTIALPKYVTQMYKAGGKRYFDYLGVNSYARNAGQLSRLLRGVRRIMNRRRDRKAGIWITELGWGDRGPKHRFIVGARGQANRIRSSLRFIRRAKGRLRLRGFVYFSWRDLRPYPPHFKDQWGLHTGLLNQAGQPKRGFNAFKHGVSALR